MKINLIAVGKLQNDLVELFKGYVKKISFYASLNLIEVKEVNHNNKAIQIKKETELILNAVPKNSKIFLCVTKGKQYTSPEFSELIDEDNLTFIIGGSHGVDETKFINKINFSKMTFPHQLFRIMLIEQIYRALAIKNGSKYHK